MKVVICYWLEFGKTLPECFSCHQAKVTTEAFSMKHYKLKLVTNNHHSLRASCLTLEIKEFRCYEANIKENEKAGSFRESNPARIPLAWAASALPLSYDSRTTTNPHNPLYVLHRWYWMPQTLSMCHQNSVRGQPENSLHLERTHSEWFYSIVVSSIFAS